MVVERSAAMTAGASSVGPDGQMSPRACWGEGSPESVWVGGGKAGRLGVGVASSASGAALRASAVTAPPARNVLAPGRKAAAGGGHSSAPATIATTHSRQRGERGLAFQNQPCFMRLSPCVFDPLCLLEYTLGPRRPQAHQRRGRRQFSRPAKHLPSNQAVFRARRTRRLGRNWRRPGQLTQLHRRTSAIIILVS
jgi:hypothetical protein